MVMMQVALGNKQPSLALTTLIQWLDNQIAARREAYDLYRAYYRGEQDVLLTDRLKKFLHPRLQFRDNYVDVVVDVLAERLKVIGFDSGDEKLGTWAWDVWRRNRMDLQQLAIHTETILLGDGYVLVDWDDEKPRFSPQMAEMIVPHYNEITRGIDWASKKWLWERDLGQDPVTRLNLYYPDRLEKYIESGGTWQPWQDEQDEGLWPLPWVAKDGSPLGVPLVHFRNRAVTEDFGQSEIDDIIPLQDLLNKTLVDLVMILDSQAFKQIWTLNIPHNKSKVDAVPGSLWEFHSESPDAAVGEWAAATLDGPLAAIQAIIQQIAGTSRTPQHFFTPIATVSGEALKTAEAGLVQKATSRSVAFGNAWEDALRLALRVQNAFGEQVVDEDAFDLETVWDEIESRNEFAHLLSLKAKRDLGISQRQIWREMGYDSEQIEEMEEELKQEKIASVNLGEAILREFQAGGSESLSTDADLIRMAQEGG